MIKIYLILQDFKIKKVHKDYDFIYCNFYANNFNSGI